MNLLEKLLSYTANIASFFKTCIAGWSSIFNSNGFLKYLIIINGAFIILVIFISLIERIFNNV